MVVRMEPLHGSHQLLNGYYSEPKDDNAKEYSPATSVIGV